AGLASNGQCQAQQRQREPEDQQAIGEAVASVRHGADRGGVDETREQRRPAIISAEASATTSSVVPTWARAEGSRDANSPTPSTRYEAAIVQYSSGGFS